MTCFSFINEILDFPPPSLISCLWSPNLLHIALPAQHTFDQQEKIVSVSNAKLVCLFALVGIKKSNGITKGT